MVSAVGTAVGTWGDENQPGDRLNDIECANKNPRTNVRGFVCHQWSVSRDRRVNRQTQNAT